jgi:hypothetical protein
VAVGITMFSDNAVSANRDAVSNDLVNLAARAQQFYRRPAALGGGGNTFNGLSADATGLAKLTNMAGGKNANGTYVIQSAGDANSVTIRGTGTENGKDGTLLVMEILARNQGKTDSLYSVN